MNKMIDTPALLASLDIVEVVGRYIQLEKDGTEHAACCPFHTESTPSFKVNGKKGFYHCFGCGAHGDAIGFVMEYRGIKFREAVDEITDGRPPTTFQPTAPKPQRDDREEMKEWQPVIPVPEDVPPPPRTFTKRMKGEWVPLEFAGMWDYRDQSGALLGHVSRFEWTADGKRKKDYFPLTWCRNANTGELKWKYQSFPKPRPLYGLPDLAAKPGAVVIINEGEKKKDAANRLLPALAAVAWAGGGKAVKYTSWEPLRGRKVLIWRDADHPGIEAAEAVAEALRDIAAAVKIIDPPAGVEEGWDLADAEAEGWTGDQVQAHIRAAARAPRPDQPAPEYDEPPPLLLDDYIESDAPDLDGAPYRALGYDHGRYYYLAGRAAQVIDLASSSHTKLNLLSIAQLSHWQQRFPSGKDSNEAMWDMAANTLMRQCEDAGVYDPEKIRGRGAWWDAGRALLHVGDRLIIDGEQKPLTVPGVKNVYEAAPILHIDTANPLTTSEAHQLVELCHMLQWEKPISRMLLPGWIFLAPICGALAWRPHIWITGGAGTGKSWVQSNIVAPCLGNTAINPQGVATEAGIRQLLGQDARPVVFDEAESEDQQAHSRIQAIMALARQASSENGGAIIKGSANGKAMTYRIRSMFAFSSIGVGVQQYADKTRVSVLALQVDPSKTAEQREAAFNALKAKAAGVITEEFAAKLRARAVSMIGIVRENAKTFAAAGAHVIGTQRLGDQYGTILAGAYGLHSNGLITQEQARKWIEKQDWTEEAALTERKDEMSCLSHILEHTVRVNGSGAALDRSIGELIETAIGYKYEDNVSKDAAGDHLLRIGIKVIASGIQIANSHTSMKKILSGTPWASEWGRILKRVDGAEAVESQRFGNGGTHRSVFIPFASFSS